MLKSETAFCFDLILLFIGATFFVLSYVEGIGYLNVISCMVGLFLMCLGAGDFLFSSRKWTV